MIFLGIKLNKKGETVYKTIRNILTIPILMIGTILIVGLPNAIYETFH